MLGKDIDMPSKEERSEILQLKEVISYAAKDLFEISGVPKKANWEALGSLERYIQNLLYNPDNNKKEAKNEPLIDWINIAIEGMIIQLENLAYFVYNDKDKINYFISSIKKRIDIFYENKELSEKNTTKE